VIEEAWERNHTASPTSWGHPAFRNKHCWAIRFRREAPKPLGRVMGPGETALTLTRGASSIAKTRVKVAKADLLAS
jgi:hypothetical protein